MTTLFYALAGGGIILVSAAVLVVLLAAGRKSKIPVMKQEELRKMIDLNNVEFYLLDFRDKENFKKGHIPGAVNVPLKNIKSFFPTEKMFTDIIVCGQTDKEAQQGARILSDTAYFRVKSLGAFSRWKGPLEKGKGLQLKPAAEVE